MHRFQRWRDIIQGVRDEDSLRRTLRDYVATVGPAVISTLPPDCQRALADDDIQAAAVTLLQSELAFNGEQVIAELLHEIAHTYAAASVRLTRLNREPLTPAAE